MSRDPHKSILLHNYVVVGVHLGVVTSCDPTPPNKILLCVLFIAHVHRMKILLLLLGPEVVTMIKGRGRLSRACSLDNPL